MTGRTYGTLTIGHYVKRKRGGQEVHTPAFAMKVEPHVAMRAKRWFPRIQQHRTGMLHLDDLPDVARDLEWFIERYPLDVDDKARARLTARADEDRTREEVMLRLLDGAARPESADWRIPARPGREYQVTGADMAHLMGGMLLGDDLGLGKAQPLDAPVLTPAGYAPMGSLAVGSTVVAGDGSATRVTGVYPQGEIDCYRITFNDGAHVECSADHLWRVRRPRRTRSKATGEQNPTHWSTLTTQQMLDIGVRQVHGQSRFYIPMIGAPDLGDGTPLPLDPYLLGVLLGDGSLTGRGLEITSADPEIVASVESALPPGVVVKHDHGPYRYRLTRTDASKPHPVIQVLRELDVFGHSSLTKFIPEVYLHAAKVDRLALLQGLMDTDGSAAPLRGGSATAQFYSSSQRLACGVQWLTESLGGTGRLTTKFAAGRDRYTVTVKMPAPLNPFRLSRKAALWGDGHQTLRPTRGIRSIERVGTKSMQCIAVDHPDRLYVTDRFVVTHNTQTATMLLRDPKTLPALIVCPTSLPHQWKGEIAEIFPDMKVHILTKTNPLTGGKNGGPYDLPDDTDVIISGYAKIHGWRDALAGRVRTVIFDEVQELRKGGTMKYQAAQHLAEGADWRLGLSATPIFNYGGEAHTIFEVLAPGALGSRSEFIQEWGGAEGTGDNVVLKDPQALGAYLRDKGLLVRRTRAEVGREIAKPQKILQEVPANADVFTDAAGDIERLAEILGSTDTETKEKWRAAGEIDYRMRHATGVAKARGVAEFARLVLESEEKIILAGWHHDVYAIWRSELAAYGPVGFTGADSPVAKRRAVEAFTKGDARVLMMSLRSGAGLDGLQGAASVVVFGELDWSPAMHDQLIGRLARDGQQGQVVAYFCVTGSGSDPVIANVLNVKTVQGESIRDPDADATLFAPNLGQADVSRAQMLLDAAKGLRHDRG